MRLVLITHVNFRKAHADDLHDLIKPARDVALINFTALAASRALSALVMRR